MKKTPNPFPVLLIRSPFAPPGPASVEWTRMLSTLSSIWPELKVCDAAMDYLIKSLATEEHLHPMMKRVDERRRDETSTSVDQGIQPQYDSVAAIQQFSDEITSAIQRMAVPDSSDVVALCEDIKAIDSFLSLISFAYHPCRFHRHGFAHTGLADEQDLKRFKDDAEANPFWHYAFNLWQPFLKAAPPALALLYVDQPGQLGPAATLASAWQKRWPQIPLQLLGPSGLTQTFSQSIIPDTYGLWPPELKACKTDIEKAVSDIFSGAAIETETDSPASIPFQRPGSRPLRAAQMPNFVQDALKQNNPLITWWACGDEIDAVTQQLYASARHGLWNHLILNDPIPTELEAFAASNANIVHSYCYQEKTLSAFSDPQIRFPVASPGYGQTKPLPGQPLWMSLQNTALIGAQLAHHDLKALIRQRIRDDGQGVFEVGKQMAYHYDAPGDLPDGHLDEIVRMVAAGGSVNTQFVRQNLERAFLIAYVEEEGVIIGNSCLKHPRKEYIDAVTQQSGIDLHDFLERGYTSVRPDYRGLGVGAKLLDGLTRRAGDHKIFSVIAETNIATQKMAMRNRTRRVATFFSHRAQKEMSVWIPEWMLPEGTVLPKQPDVGD